jgi:membrane protein implicated in regulation of membrane protease activity
MGMTWADFYLICFLVGFSLSLLSVLSGAFHFHIPGLHHHVHLHHGHAAHGHAGDGYSSILNFATLPAFLAWFGGIGFLITKFSSIWLWLAFVLAVSGGLAGAAIVFGFVFKVLLADEKPIQAIDYDMVGVLGRVTSTIREGGTGEITFSQAGGRRSAAARSDDGVAIPKDADVFVTRYERGIAYVRRFEDLSLTDAKEA